MTTVVEKAKKNSLKPSPKEQTLPVGVSMLTLSGFRICQMSNTQLAQAALLRRKFSR
ncbi:MAG: hypothetical protein KKG91_02865 [Candidatus Omnitrophica bacterium]|nr:hypothetical protein [Candidatus Omnitrophota bacterium]